MSFFKKFIVALFTFALTFSFVSPAGAVGSSPAGSSPEPELILTKSHEFLGDTEKPYLSVRYNGLIEDGKDHFINIFDTTNGKKEGVCTVNQYSNTCTIILYPASGYDQRDYIPSGTHKFKAYLNAFPWGAPEDPWNPVMDNTPYLVATSNEVRFDRKYLDITLNSSTPDFGRYTYPNIYPTLNQQISGTSHETYLVDISTNKLISHGEGDKNGHIFNFGYPHYYQAIFAKKPLNADGTFKEKPTFGDLTDIQARSNIVSLSRQPWRVELQATAPMFSSDYSLQAGTFKGGGAYTTYIVENATGKILTHNVDSSYDYYLNYPNTGHGSDASWATAYVARVWASNQGGDGIEPHYLSDLQDIQANSNGYSLQTSVVYNPEETKGGANPSQDCAQGCHGDPINTATGEFFENITDLSTPGSGITPQMSRSYGIASKDENSKLGYGWKTSYDMSLYAPDNGTISTSNKLKIKQENGSIITFQKLDNGAWETNAATKATLGFVNNQYVLTRNKAEIFIFDPTGKLVQIKDTYGSIINFAYTNNQVSSATDAKGNTLNFSYNVNGYLENVDNGLGNSINYAYDNSQRLITATNSNGSITNYTYDADNRMTSQTNALGGITANEYDGYNRVVKQTDPLGNEMTLSYAESGDTKTTTITYPDTSVVRETYYKGQLATKTLNPSTPNERTWKYNYNDANQIISLVNPDGTSMSSLYDENGNVVKSINSLGRATEVTYNEFNKPLTAKDAAGNITTNTYDAQGNLATTTNVLGETTSFTYNADGTVASATNAAGNEVGAIASEHTSLFGYNAKGLLTTTTNALGNTSLNTYDALGRIVENISPRGMEANANQNDFKNTVAYNSLNLPASTKDPLQNETSLTYDAMGNVLTSEDALGNVSSYTYDVMGNVLTKTNALQQTVSYHYDNMNRVDSITDANGKTSTITYDIFGQVVETKDVLQRTSKQEWDISGNLIASVDNNNARTEYIYDILGNLVSTKNPSGNVSTFSYDVLDRLVSIKDAEGKETKTEYDALGRAIKTIYPDSTYTTVAYDISGNISSKTDQAGKTRSWEYDVLGRKIQYTDEANKTESYTYDAGSNLVSKTRADGSVVGYVYDTRNLLTNVDYPGTESDLAYVYDALGRKVSEQKGTESATTYAYDALGQLTSRGPPNSKVSYEYDVLGNTTKLTYPSGRVVNYGFDDASQLTNLTDAALGTVSYGYDNRGNETSITLPNQVVESSTYDVNNRRTSVKIAKGTDIIYSKNNAYSSVGNIIQQEKTGTGVSTPTLEDFSYDPLSRLTTQKKNSDGSALNAYGYDAVGNLTTINGTVQSFDDSGKILTSGSKTFAYDGRNNRTSTTDSSAAANNKNYNWSVNNLLTQVEKSSDSIVVSYAYDALGLLGTRSVNSVLSNSFVWDTTSSVPLMLSDGEFEYIYGASRVPVAQVKISNGEIKYLHADVNGSITASTNASGTLTGSVVYSPYGTTTDAPISKFGFAGEWTDPITGHSYLRARWLDTTTGTFLSEDPLTQSTGQAFGYTKGNPLQQIDPLGLCSILAGDLGNIGSDCYSFADTPTFQNITDSVAGIGDEASLGGTKLIRQLYGFDKVVNNCSSAYQTASRSTAIAVIATPGGFGKTVVKRSAKELLKEQRKATQKYFSQFNDPTLAYIRSFPKQGGSYGELASNSAGIRGAMKMEINHMPAKNRRLTPGATIRDEINDGPAIMMDKYDHYLTRTHGGKAGAALRDDIGLTREQIFLKDIKEIQDFFPGKYDKGIQQAIEYARSIGYKI